MNETEQQAPRVAATLPAEVRNVILCGFMGTGKTASGRRLAERLGWSFVDTDQLIEQRAGKPITRIFAEDGESAFRALESEIAGELAALERHVIATGGGMPLRAENLAALERAGRVVLLEAEAETIFERTRRNTNRPLLHGDDPLGAIRRLLEERRACYGSIALAVPTDGRSPEEVAGELHERIEGRPSRSARVRVSLGDRSYPIEIGHDWIGRLGARLAVRFPPRPIVLVTNPEIARLWAEPVLAALRGAGYTVSVVQIPEGERHKTLETVRIIYDHLLEGRHTRQSGVIALGGGVVGDITGFAAATFMRGVAYIQLPTTLLAMVDSSVGGKTGVNHPAGKNLIGAFWQPTFVGAELRFLDTLPDAELRSGLAEVIKYGVIADPEFFEYLEANIERALARDPAVLTHLVTRSCAIKADVVARDEHEGGVRAILNFGHTFGHAVEALAHYEGVRHGEAVAMGMAAAMRMGATRGMVGAGDVERVERLLARAGLPVTMPRHGLDDYWRVMGSDKKVKDGRVRFILPEAIGRVGIYADVSEAEVRNCLEGVMG